MAVIIRGMDKVLAGVRDIERRLTAPAEFYAAHAEKYQSAARQTALEILTALRPPEITEADWSVKVRSTVDRITADPLLFGDVMLISLSDPASGRDGTHPSHVPAGNQSSISLDDIRKWIEAGLRGEDGGKRITEADRDLIGEKGIDAVALNVKAAVFSNYPKSSYARLRNHIRDYLITREDRETDPLLDAVLAAWMQVFPPLFESDLARWVEKVCRL